MNLSTGFQEVWLNNLNNAITLDPNCLSNLQCTRNEDGNKETPSRAKKKTSKGEIIEVNGGRIVRSVGRKDRHSKVCTARGTRDRRVRLSPNTAIQFYDVQDRLGYDRPSKAIDWLMKEAKAAIDAIVDSPRASCTNSSGFNQTGQVGFLNSSSVLQNECPRNSYNQGGSASSQTWQNGTFLFSGGATSNPMENLVQHHNEFTQQREPLQSSFLCPAVPSSSSSRQFFSNQNGNYLNNGFSYEFLSRLEEQSPVSRNPSLNNSHLQE